MTTRRSSFFCRQLNSVLDTSSFENENSTSSSKEEQLILNHVAKVEQAISDWRAEYWRSKSEYKEIEKYKDNVNVIRYNQCQSILSAEDIEFLNNRLDYQTIIRRLETLVAKVEIVKVKMIKANARMNGLVNGLENAIVDLKRKICKYLLECDESADLFASLRNENTLIVIPST